MKALKHIAIVAFLVCSLSLAHAGDLTKQITYKHKISETGQIQVQTITRVFDEGKEISREPSGWSNKINPTDSTVGKDARTAAIMTNLKATVILKPIITGAGLESTVTYDNSVTELGHVQVRRITRAYENGVLIGRPLHRYVISPGDDYSKADPVSKATAEAVHTQTVIDAYKAKIAAQNP